MIMLCRLALSLLLGLALLTLPAAARDDAVRTFGAQSDEAPAPLAARLAAMGLTRNDGAGVPMLSYVGDGAPAAALDWMAATFAGLAPDFAATGRALVFSIAVIPAPGGGSQLRLMLRDAPGTMSPDRQDAALDAGLRAEGRVLLREEGAGDCSGQLVLSEPAPRQLVAPAYAARMAEAGFAVQDLSDAEVSFFVGNAPGCAFFLYVQTDPEDTSASIVVLRYAED